MELLVVLVRPRYADNVGSVARLMENFGGGELRMVAPNALTLEGLAQRVARAGESRLAEAVHYAQLADAIVDVDLAVATSHKTGKHRQTVTPWQLAGGLLPVLNPERLALVIGPEDSGLTNDEIDLCHRLVSIPSSSPMNLSHSVAVMLYEVLVRPRAAPDGVERRSDMRVAYERMLADEPQDASRPPRPESDRGGDEEPAPAAAIPRIVASAERALARTGYPAHKKPMRAEMAKLTDILARAHLTHFEMNFLIGMFNHVDEWAEGESD